MNEGNGRKEFDEAKLIWDALAAVGFSTSPKKLVDKINQLKRGLPKEDEFTALSMWLDNCTLIHKLDQRQYPELSKQEYQVPDLFACYKHNGKDVAVLIEVKSTKNTKLRLSNADYNRRLKYSKLVNLPVLVAWHLKGWDLWCLFELSKMQKKVSAFHIDFEEAMKADLMGVLSGNVIFFISEGTKLKMKIEIEKGTEIRDDYNQTLKEFNGVVRDVGFFDANDERIPSKSPLSKFLNLCFLLVDNDVHVTDDGQYATQTFSLTQDRMVFAYHILGVVTFGLKVLKTSELNWLEIIKNESFKSSYEEIKEAAEEGRERGVVRYTVQNVPQPFPQFLGKK